MDGGLTSEEALSKLKLKQPLATGQENCQNMNSVWQQENMRTFKDFLSWYNNRDVFRALEAVQKKVDSYYNKIIDMLKLGCTLPFLATICLHKSTTAKFYTFVEGEKIYWRKFVKTWLVDHPLYLH